MSQALIKSYNDNDMIILDINDKKGPNKWGHDLFKFYVVTDLNNMNRYYLFPAND